MADQTGLRERKKAATKAALSHATMRLAIEHGGIEAVTADDIAAEAGVSTRTFHNYFHNKEAALLHDFNELTGQFLAGLRERARHQPIWDALRDTCIGLEVDKRIDFDLLQCREELVKGSPTLVTHQAGQFMELFADAVGIVADATGTGPDDMYPRLILGAALIAMKVANEQWIVDRDKAPLAEFVTEAFAHFESGITRPTTTSHS